MKVSELIATLQREMDEHGDVEVLYTWEDRPQGVDQSVYFSPEPGVLFLDADGRYYKPVEACTHSSPPGKWTESRRVTPASLRAEFFRERKG